MPLQTRTYNLSSEEQRLQDEIDEIDSTIGDISDMEDVPEDTAQMLLERLKSLQHQHRGVEWACDEAYEAEYCPAWDEDVGEITLGGLTGGEFGRMQDDLSGSGTGAARVYQVEAGTEDAPYIDNSMDKDQRIGTVSGLPTGFLMWAEAQIDDLSMLSGNGQMSFDELLADLES